MKHTRPRIAVRAAILKNDKLLMVNAFPGQKSDLWCLPGGGVEPGQSLIENLCREVMEETGLTVSVGDPILVNEFHDPRSGWHQVEVFFRAVIKEEATTLITLEDPEGVVNRYQWASRDELPLLRHKPGRLGQAVWGENKALYDPLELITF